jgi:hypothetical protein
VKDKEKNECYAYFRLVGSFDPAAITTKAGINPTKVGLEGEYISGTQKRRTFSYWNLHSRLDRSSEIERHISDVLDQLDVNKAGFRELSLQYGGTMELVGYFWASYPGVVFEREVINRLDQYALSVDCDFYFSSADEKASNPISSK